MIDISATIQAKSDQMNADDLIGNETVITVTDVKVTKTPDQPLTIHYQGDEGKPYKPCLSMRRVLSALWGKDASVWIGQSMLLFNDPSVKWSGKEVGGIRISKLTGIDKPKSISMNESKHKKTTWQVYPLIMEEPVQQAQQRATWPDDAFNGQLPKIKSAIESGSSTAEKVIESLMKKAYLTDGQVKIISEIKANEDTE